MPRSLTLGNGNILVNLDNFANLRDLYFPYVGLENHVGEKLTHRIGVSVDGAFSWLSDGSWELKTDYQSGSLAGLSVARNDHLGVSLTLNDIVYNEKDIFVRKVTVKNTGAGRRKIKVFFCHQFQLYESASAHTAYYDPINKVIIHYRNERAFLINAQLEGVGFSDYSTGVFGSEGKEGTHKDAEDGILSKNPIEHGQADSAIALEAEFSPEEEKFIYYWIAMADSVNKALSLNQYVLETGAGHIIQTTHDYWQAWANRQSFVFYGLGGKVIEEFKKSLFIIRAHVDQGGGIIASGDSGMLQKGKDTYAYVWPRDAAYAALALDYAGDFNVSERFFDFCNDVITDGGYFMHKYSPDRMLGSSWHGWLREGEVQLPIQEDETAVVLWSLWQHYQLSKNLEFVEKVYNSLIKRAADFMVLYRDELTGLPKGSFDLWEEKFGIHTYTAASVYGALTAAANFANLLGKVKGENRYREAAESIKVSILRHLYDEQTGTFRKLINVRGSEVLPDNTIDMSSVFGIFNFGVLSPDDERLAGAIGKTISALNNRAKVGGIARYQNDLYYRVDPYAPGNPWFVTTMWHAQYLIATVKKEEELTLVHALLEWAMNNASPSGIMSEQLNPNTGEQLSAAPLVWSHSEFVTTIIKYLNKCEELGLCKVCNPVRQR